MATSYSNLAQAQAAYDTVFKQKERAQRNAHIAEQQAVMGVNNYLKQNGYNGGAAESILLRARNRGADYSAYDAQLADLAAIIQRFKSAGRRRAANAANQATNAYAAYTGSQNLPDMAKAIKGVPGYQGVQSPASGAISGVSRGARGAFGRR